MSTAPGVELVTFADFRDVLRKQNIGLASSIETAAHGYIDDAWCYTPTDMLRAIARAAELLQAEHPILGYVSATETVDSFVAPESWEHDATARTLASLVLTNLSSRITQKPSEGLRPPRWLRRNKHAIQETSADAEPIPSFAMTYNKLPNACDAVERAIIINLRLLHSSDHGKGTIGLVDNRAIWIGEGDMAVTIRRILVDNYPIPAGAVIAMGKDLDGERGKVCLQDVSGFSVALRRLSTLALPPALRVEACDNGYQGLNGQDTKNMFATLSIEDIRDIVDQKVATLKS